MGKHEDLKIINDTIGFDVSVLGKEFIKREGQIPGYFQEYDTGWRCNVREIIFTREFMEKLMNYRSIMQEDIKIIGTKKHQEWQDCFNNILDNLDDPVSYLYNLIIGN